MVSVRAVLKGDVCMLAGTITALDTDAPGGGVTAATGRMGARRAAFGTTGSSAHATTAARPRSALNARRAPRGVRSIDFAPAKVVRPTIVKLPAFRRWLQHPRSGGGTGERSRE